MSGQTERALAKNGDQQKTTKSKKKRSTGTKKASSSSTRKKTTSSRSAKQTENGGLPIMKLRAIDIVDGSGANAPPPDKAKDQDNEQPQVIHMPPPAANEAGAADEEASLVAASTAVENEDHANENQVSDPELLELLEQLSVTIDTANTVLDAAANVPPETLPPQSDNLTEPPLPQPDNTMHMQNSQGPDQQFDRLADRLSGMQQEKDDLRPLAERFASKPNSGDMGREKRGKFGLVANAALTGVIVAAGVGWLAYTNPWIFEGGSEPTAPAPEPEQAVTIQTQETAAANPEAAKDQTQLGGQQTPLPKIEQAPLPRTEQASPPKTEQAALPRTENEVQPPATDAAPAAPKPSLSALTPPEDDPVPMQSPEKAPVTAAPALEPIRGTAGDKIALGIEIPADAGGAEMSIMIQSVPKQMELSAGKNLGSGNWLLTTGQLDGLTLITKRDLQPGEYQIEVIMVRSDGKVPDARKVAVAIDAAVQKAPAPKNPAVQPRPADTVKETAVAPTAAPPPAPPAAAPKPALPPLSAKQVSNILKRGDALLAQGDVAGARLLLGYAATRGNKDAMLKLGRSYDPAFLSQLGVRGVEPDPAKAAEWYERAKQTTATAQ